MVKKDLLIRSKEIPVLRLSLLSLLFTLLFYTNGTSQIRQIVCNDHVNISVDDNCEAHLRPDMILEGPTGQYAPPFTITVGTTNVINNNTNHPIVTKPGHYNVTVTNSQGNFCWGTITVEDKLPPVVDCDCPVGNTDPRCEILCTDEDAFIAGTFTNYPQPTAADACTSITSYYNDEVVVHGHNGCNGKTIFRTWTFTDAYGNSASCTSEFRVLPGDLNDVTLDAPYNSPHLTCGSDVSMEGIFEFYKAKLFDIYKANYRALVPGTYPTIAAADAAALNDAISEAYKYAYPVIHGKPITGKVCNILAAKSDTDLPVCNPACSNSKKVIRVWTILDWCNSTTRTFTQIVIAVDEEAPTVSAKDVTISVDPWSCEGTVVLPYPEILHDNCDANPSYTVRGPLGVTIRKDIPSNRYIATGIAKGSHTFTYVATDCCGNEGTDNITVTVIDKTPPIAVAKQHIIISLTTDGNHGTAKLYASSVDNGSYDSCTPVHLEIRREKDENRDNDGCNYTGNFTYNADGHPNDGSTNPNSPNYDPDNGEYVKFCCEDITFTDGPVPYGIVKVWMRVWDDGDMNGVFGSAGDNYNETWVEVRVEDKLPPQIICPPTVTIECDDDINDLNLTGKARAFSNCLDLEVEYTDREFLNTCNVGYVQRTWRIKNRPGTVCSQTIYLAPQPNTFTEQSIVWPADITTDCTNDATSAKPTWSSGSCDIIGYTLHSDTFYFEGNACMKILNRWTVLNWCTYDPNDIDSEGIYSHTQVVKIIDNEKPTLGSCSDKVYEINDHNDEDGDGNKCEIRNLALTMTATDQGQCSSDWLKWIVFVDLWGDGTYEYEYSSFLPATDGTFNDTNGNGIPDRYVAPTGQGQEVRIIIPEDIVGSLSRHKVLWKVVDGCGNVTSCTQNFTVEDKKKPTPYCLNISSALMVNGQVELWAADFNVNSFDNCTAKQNLLYTFNEAFPIQSRLNETHYFKGNGLSATEAEYFAGKAQKWLPSMKSSGKIFTCDDYPSVDIKMSVWDERGNSDFCTVKLSLADNQGACGGSLTSNVSGRLVAQNGKVVANANMSLDNGFSQMLRSTTSTSAGYNFYNAIMHYDYTVSGQKNDDYLNGVTTLDLVYIQRHILGLSKFTNPYDIIAADANNDGKVTSADLTELRKLILGLNASLPNNNSWRFINSSVPFANPNNPFPFNEVIQISNLSSNITNQDFIAVKVGDVNGSASANSEDIVSETRSAVVLNAQDEKVLANESVAVSFNADIDNIYGLQFTLQINNADLTEIYVGGQKLSESNIAKLSDKVYTVSWNELSGVNGHDLITLHLTAKTNANISDMVTINSTVTNAEMYSGDNLQASKLSLRFAEKESAEFVLYQNEPNPFSDKTQISFTLPEAGEVTLKVYDVNGKIVYTKSSSFGKGINAFTLHKSDLPSSGVMIYQIESGANTATRKMIGLE